MVNQVFLSPPEPPSDQGRRARSFLSGRTADLLTLLGFLCLSVALFAGAWRAPTSSVAGTGTEDIGIIVWFLRWIPFGLGHAQNPLLSTYLNAPHGVN